MALELNGTTGVSLVQDGVITDSNLPAGSVLQVVQGSTSTPVTTTSTSFVSTGLSASITPSSTSSKILVTASVQMRLNDDDTNAYGALQISRNGSAIYTPPQSYELGILVDGVSRVRIRTRIPLMILDSPNTTSSRTYSIEAQVNSSELIFQEGGASSYITLMEIAG